MAPYPLSGFPKSSGETRTSLLRYKPFYWILSARITYDGLTQTSLAPLACSHSTFVTLARDTALARLHTDIGLRDEIGDWVRLPTTVRRHGATLDIRDGPSLVVAWRAPFALDEGA